MHKNISKELYHFLSPIDKEVKADLIIGFGHFDLRLPEHCALVYSKGLAPKIMFTGGVGAGSADFKNPEAIEFLNYVRHKYPKIKDNNILIEASSTNTGDNLKYSIQILKEKGLLESVKRIILVATPTRQLRVFLTAKMYFPKAELISLPPSSSFDIDMEMNTNKGIDFKEHIIGELERIKKYPALGFACSTEIPGTLKNLI
jgi:hypothetical protein